MNSLLCEQQTAPRLLRATLFHNSPTQIGLTGTHKAPGNNSPMPLWLLITTRFHVLVTLHVFIWHSNKAERAVCVYECWVILHADSLIGWILSSASKSVSSWWMAVIWNGRRCFIENSLLNLIRNNCWNHFHDPVVGVVIHYWADWI